MSDGKNQENLTRRTNAPERVQEHAQGGAGSPEADVHNRKTLPIGVTAAIIAQQSEAALAASESTAHRENPFNRSSEGTDASQGRAKSNPSVRPPSQHYRHNLGSTHPGTGPVVSGRLLCSGVSTRSATRWHIEKFDASSWAVAWLDKASFHITDQTKLQHVIDLDGELPTAILHTPTKTFFGCSTGRLFCFDRTERRVGLAYELVRNEPIDALSYSETTGRFVMLTRSGRAYVCKSMDCPLDFKRISDCVIPEAMDIDELVDELVMLDARGRVWTKSIGQNTPPRAVFDTGARPRRAKLSRDSSLLFVHDVNDVLTIYSWSAGQRKIHQTSLRSNIVDFCTDHTDSCFGLMLQDSSLLLTKIF